MSAVGVSSLAGFSAVSAQHAGGQSEIIDKIATKFNLNKDAVAKVFEAEHEAREADHKARQQERLQKLVDEGTLTAEQKSAVEAKFSELHEKREAEKGTMKDLTPDERRTKMQQARTDMETWAKEQGIDLDVLSGVFGSPGGGMHGRGGPRNQ